MSWEALNWAGKQRTRSCSVQIVLYVLANCANPQGVVSDWWDEDQAWWEYMLDRTRLKRSTIFDLFKELEDANALTFQWVKPEGNSRRRAVVRLNYACLINEDEPEKSSSTWTPEPSVGDQKSTSRTISEGEESTTWTNSVEESPGAGREESTTRTRTLCIQENPSPPKPPHATGPQGGRQEATEEPIGFAAFFASYPEHQIMSRAKALEEFVKLSSVDQKRATDAATLYGSQLARNNRKPINANRWLRERRFAEYGAGVQSTGSRVFVPEGSEAWKAWCNFAAVAYGGTPKIPHFWGAPGQRGATTPTPWPLGGQGWLVPFEHWVFVERATAQFNRWTERVHEVLGRAPLAVTARSTHYAHKLISRDNARWGDREFVGLLVPSEWPPRKTLDATGPPPSPTLTAEDLADVGRLK